MSEPLSDRVAWRLAQAEGKKARERLREKREEEARERLRAEREEAARRRLRLYYGMTDIRQDPGNGTWWIGSKLRPDLLNLDSLHDAAKYLDRLPEEMVARLFEPRGSDSEPQHQE